MVHTRKIEYVSENVVLEGYCAEVINGTSKPAVIVAHDWSGRNDFACQKAEELAALGYVGFALDMYGLAKIGKTDEEKKALIQPLLDDRALLRARIVAALDTVRDMPGVNPARIAALGFCFGGLCVLDLARSGADVRGVVSVHGLLNPPGDLTAETIRSKVLVLHGDADPSVPPKAVSAFEQEMREAEVDWQLHVYGNTMHAFTNPKANDPELGRVYNPQAAKRAWTAMKAFFVEIFS